MNSDNRTSNCGKCGHAFEYPDCGRARRFCPDCQKEKVVTRRVVHNEQLRAAIVSTRDCPRAKTLQQIAEVLGIPATVVSRIERSALVKARRHPALREPGYAMQVERWVRLSQTLRRVGLTEEADAVLAEVKEFQTVWQSEFTKATESMNEANRQANGEANGAARHVYTLAYRGGESR